MTALASGQEKQEVAILGAGAVGTALGRRLVQRGYTVRAVVSRSERGAQRLAEAVGAPVASGSPGALPDAVRVVFCCVPDAAVEPVAEQLYLLPRSWSGCLVAHTSGALTSDALAPLSVRGALTLSFHPMQSFPEDASPEAFDGIRVGLEGRPAAVEWGQAIAEDLGAHPLVLTPEEKARYHLAASVASNFFVTLHAMAGEVLGSVGVSRTQAREVLHPLVEGTWRNLGRRWPEEALTGPVARGDERTVRLHLEALAKHLPHLTPAYVALAMESVRVAVRGGHLSEGQAQRLLDLLHAALEPHRDSLF